MFLFKYSLPLVNEHSSLTTSLSLFYFHLLLHPKPVPSLQKSPPIHSKPGLFPTNTVSRYEAVFKCTWIFPHTVFMSDSCHDLSTSSLSLLVSHNFLRFLVRFLVRRFEDKWQQQQRELAQEKYSKCMLLLHLIDTSLSLLVLLTFFPPSLFIFDTCFSVPASLLPVSSSFTFLFQVLLFGI